MFPCLLEKSCAEKTHCSSCATLILGGLVSWIQATLGLTWMAQSKCAPVDNLYELLPVAARHAMEVIPTW
eukprot:994214-Amphidinium_carterae.1